jgi:predicted transcriptional regulator
MEAKAKERLHQLVDRVPDGEVHTAERFLEYLASAADPVMRALMNAPEMDEPLSDADREALEEGRRALEAGDVVSHEELRKAIGL